MSKRTMIDRCQRLGILAVRITWAHRAESETHQELGNRRSRSPVQPSGPGARLAHLLGGLAKFIGAGVKIKQARRVARDVLQKCRKPKACSQEALWAFAISASTLHPAVVPAAPGGPESQTSLGAARETACEARGRRGA